MNRILTFHTHKGSYATGRMSPSAYYMDAEYEKVAVRIYAEVTPDMQAKFDIYDDGVSIFKDGGEPLVALTSGKITQLTNTYITLPANATSEDLADTFNDAIIEKGSWVYCEIVDGGNGKGFTVQLELHQLSEDELETD